VEKFYVFVKDNSLWDSSLLRILKKRNLVAKDFSEAKCILVFGGDGTMLRAIRKFWKKGLPFAGFNFGHVGFLVNEATERILLEVVSGRQKFFPVYLLQAQLYDKNGKYLGNEIAFNEFYAKGKRLLHTPKIKVTVDDKVRFDPLICDGVIVCTQAGSTAYNASAGGEILPIETQAMVLTGIAPTVFHRWRSSVLPRDTKVVLEAVDAEERPVAFISDNKVMPGVNKVVISYSDCSVALSFAVSQDFREKVLKLRL